MLVAGEVLLDLSFPGTAARLANLARGGSLTRASQRAYDDGLTGLWSWSAHWEPRRACPSWSRVHFLEVATRGESAVLALPWEATGPGSRLFPALDADNWLIPAGEHSARLSLAELFDPKTKTNWVR